MAPALLQVILSCYAKFPKNSFSIFAFTYEKHIVSKKNCIAREEDKMCLLPKCSYRVFFLG